MSTQKQRAEFGREQLLFRSPMGDAAYFHNESMIIEFAARRGVVSTSNLNGGYRTDLQYAFNHSCGRDLAIQQKRCPGLKGANIQEHYAAIACELGLPPDSTTGMGTAALIENAAIARASHHGVEVMAVATAGIDVNGGRAADPAAYDEFERRSLLLPAGTINVFLFINARLDAGALTRAVMTATEAKTVALDELMAPSMYSEGKATGSGTDSLIVICNDEAELVLYNTGKHVLLGEMIGVTVRDAVTEALAKQTGMTPQRQASVEHQAKRYDLTKQAIIRYCQHAHPDASVEQLELVMELLDRDPHVLAQMASLVHLIDQHRWGILPLEALLEASQQALDHLLSSEGLAPLDLSRERKHRPAPNQPYYKTLLSDMRLCLAHLLYHRAYR